MLLAGLLKLFPLIVLSTALRERPRTFFVIAAAVGLIILAFFHWFRDELSEALGNIPPGGFGSVNLPFYWVRYPLRLYPELDRLAWFTALPYSVMAVLLVATFVQVIYLARNGNLVAAFAKMPERDAIFLVIGAALIAGCFFAGASPGYRGVHLIFVVAGFVAMRRAADNATTRSTLSWALIVVVFLMWQGLVCQSLLRHEVPGTWFAFLFYDVLWWRLAALLLAMLAIFGVRSQLFAALQREGGLHRGQGYLHRKE
jgi:hypothetical protein